MSSTTVCTVPGCIRYALRGGGNCSTHKHEPITPGTRSTIEDLLEYFENRADTRDTSDGPAPNEEMLWADRLRRELGK